MDGFHDATERLFSEEDFDDTEVDGLEKRQSPRFATNAAGRLVFGIANARSGWNRSVPVVACDVSAGGMLLCSSFRPVRPLRSGATVSVKLILDGAPILVRARIAWLSDNRHAWIAGLELDQRQLGDRERLGWEKLHLSAAGFY